jgi:hypothetical protein
MTVGLPASTCPAETSSEENPESLLTQRGFVMAVRDYCEVADGYAQIRPVWHVANSTATPRRL